RSTSAANKTGRVNQSTLSASLLFMAFARSFEMNAKCIQHRRSGGRIPPAAPALSPIFRPFENPGAQRKRLKLGRSAAIVHLARRSLKGGHSSTKRGGRHAPTPTQTGQQRAR